MNEVTKLKKRCYDVTGLKRRGRNNASLTQAKCQRTKKKRVKRILDKFYGEE